MSGKSFRWLVMSAVLSACASAQSQVTQIDDPATITRAEFAQLKWIEGTWRGSGANQAPFYERYRFTNDTTLAVDAFTDSTMTRINETSYFVLANGKLTNTNPNLKWEATKLTDKSVTFTPVVGVRNTFVWDRQTADSWIAVLYWPPSGGQPARERVYTMVRTTLRIKD
jgi:hypothetical protein